MDAGALHAVAVHEAGHAVVAARLLGADHVTYCRLYNATGTFAPETEHRARRGQFESVVVTRAGGIAEGLAGALDGGIAADRGHLRREILDWLATGCWSGFLADGLTEDWTRTLGAVIQAAEFEATTVATSLVERWRTPILRFAGMLEQSGGALEGDELARALHAVRATPSAGALRRWQFGRHAATRLWDETVRRR